jgi:hypothetical protein
MPDRDDPDGVVLNSIEEPVGRDDDFAEGEVGELGQRAAGIGKRFSRLRLFSARSR